MSLWDLVMPLRMIHRSATMPAWLMGDAALVIAVPFVIPTPVTWWCPPWCLWCAGFAATQGDRLAPAGPFIAHLPCRLPLSLCHRHCCRSTAVHASLLATDCHCFGLGLANFHFLANGHCHASCHCCCCCPIDLGYGCGRALAVGAAGLSVPPLVLPLGDSLPLALLQVSLVEGCLVVASVVW